MSGRELKLEEEIKELGKEIKELENKITFLRNLKNKKHDQLECSHVSIRFNPIPHMRNNYYEEICSSCGFTINSLVPKEKYKEVIKRRNRRVKI